jgi:hypothetical protein
MLRCLEWLSRSMRGTWISKKISEKRVLTQKIAPDAGDFFYSW